MKMITASVISHVGTVRKNHEDNFLFFGEKLIDPSIQQQMTLEKCPFVCDFTVQETEKAVFAVSDGMGGHSMGEIASYMAVSLLSGTSKEMLNSQSIEENVKACSEYINIINREINKCGNEKSEMYNLGATLTVFVANDNKAAVLNVGDSRAYRYDGSKITQITKDHTEGQRLLDLKLLTSEEVESFSSSKSLTRYLGMNTGSAKLKADVSFINDLNSKEWFVLCSDGLTDALDPEEIAEILNHNFEKSDIKAAVKQLVNLAIVGSKGKKGSADNITVMLIELKI